MQSIRRGTTPTLQFTTTLTENEVEACYITIRQAEIVIEKDNEDIVWDGHKIITALTQQETLSLCARPARVQIRVKLANTQASATQILDFDVEDVLKSGVI